MLHTFLITRQFIAFCKTIKKLASPGCNSVFSLKTSIASLNFLSFRKVYPSPLRLNHCMILLRVSFLTASFTMAIACSIPFVLIIYSNSSLSGAGFTAFKTDISQRESCVCFREGLPDKNAIDFASLFNSASKKWSK